MNSGLRVYFTGLDEHNVGRVGYVELNPSDPRQLLRETQRPVLDIGPPGAFDDCGVNASSAVVDGSQVYLYYIGWQRTERVPYMLFTGVAVSGDGGEHFERVQRTPVLDRTPAEPFSRSAPCVRRDEQLWRAWYWSCTEWTREESAKTAPWIHYNNVIRYAESADGINWQSVGDPCVIPEGDDYSVGRPWVIVDRDVFRMWFSIRSRKEPYRIGYAESQDGIRWRRDDAAAGIARSTEGWDSEMIAFPCVVALGAEYYMFYNGNGNGRTGFGVAVLDGGSLN
jgi:hypothetical protein